MLSDSDHSIYGDAETFLNDLGLCTPSPRTPPRNSHPINAPTPVLGSLSSGIGSSTHYRGGPTPLGSPAVLGPPLLDTPIFGSGPSDNIDANMEAVIEEALNAVEVLVELRQQEEVRIDPRPTLPTPSRIGNSFIAY